VISGSSSVILPMMTGDFIAAAQELRDDLPDTDVHRMASGSPTAAGAHTDFGPCKVIVLAGGFGTRLAEHTAELPKPMVQIGERPMLWHILKIYSHYGFNDFIIAAGYKSNIIKRFFLEYREQMSDLVFDFTSGSVERGQAQIEPWRVAVIDTGIETLTGGRIRRLAEHIGRKPFMMTYGDGVADINLHALMRFHKNHGKLATVTVAICGETRW
jgi:glucose-1-phosphate cytidylyltransferase